MARQIPDYPNPVDRTTPLPAAYGTTGTITLDLVAGTGLATLRVYASAAAAAAGSSPVGSVSIAFGQALAPGVTAPTVAEFLALPGVQVAWETILAALDQHGWVIHPALAGSTEVA